jgi:hypothetical protein
MYNCVPINFKVWFRFEDYLNIDRPNIMYTLYRLQFAVSYYFKLFSTDFSSTQIVCTIRLADHGTKPGTAIQCKTKDSNCHRQNSV